MLRPVFLFYLAGPPIHSVLKLVKQITPRIHCDAPKEGCHGRTHHI